MPTVAISPEYRCPGPEPEGLEAVLHRLNGSVSRTMPYAFAFTPDLLPLALFDAIRDAFPTPQAGMSSVRDRRGNDNYPDARLALTLPKASSTEGSALPEPIRAVQRILTTDRFVHALLGKFAANVGPRLTDVERTTGQSQVSVGTGVELIYDRSGFALAPHTDGPRKLVTGLLYFADPDDPVELGTVLYEPLQPEFASNGRSWVSHDRVRPFARAPYRANAFLSFARSNRSLHGVEATTSDRPRRLIQYSIFLA